MFATAKQFVSFFRNAGFDVHLLFNGVEHVDLKSESAVARYDEYIAETRSAHSMHSNRASLQYKFNSNTLICVNNCRLNAMLPPTDPSSAVR